MPPEEAAAFNIYREASAITHQTTGFAGQLRVDGGSWAPFSFGAAGLGSVEAAVTYGQINNSAVRVLLRVTNGGAERVAIDLRFAADIRFNGVQQVELTALQTGSW
jgi:hypothetical protein